MRVIYNLRGEMLRMLQSRPAKRPLSKCKEKLKKHNEAYEGELKAMTDERECSAIKHEQLIIFFRLDSIALHVGFSDSLQTNNAKCISST